MSIEKVISARLSPFIHGFYSRKGGVSSGIYKGLNCGLGSHDNQINVEKNKALVAEDIGVNLSDLLGLYQVHSAIAIIVDKPMKYPQKADAMVTSTPNLGLTVLSADCQPVLFADSTAGVIAAAHAGWRGTFNGILEATVEKMEILGAERENIQAVIGPCISQKAYEVGKEFFERFSDNDSSYSNFFTKNGKTDKYLFDLAGFGLHQLREAGIEKCEWVGECTYSAPEKYFSYRYKTHKVEIDYGRLISVIRI